MESTIFMDYVIFFFKFGSFVIFAKQWCALIFNGKIQELVNLYDLEKKYGIIIKKRA